MKPAPTAQRSIALIGFPCSGKTTVGRLLATALNRPWLDSDAEIESHTGHPPAHWLQTQGEPAFREIEKKWLQAWQAPGQATEPCVLSTGGGLPCYQNNLEILRTKALTIYLDAEFATLQARLSAPPGHALTRLYDPSALQALYARRHAIYRQADLQIAAQGEPEAILQALLLALHTNKNLS